MNTDELNKLGGTYITDYLGTVSAHAWPPLTTVKPYSFISNTRVKGTPGEHWIAVHVGKRKTYFYDTYGSTPTENRHADWKRWLDSSDPNWKHFPKQTQKYNTSMCGPMCLEFLYKMGTANGDAKSVALSVTPTTAKMWIDIFKRLD